MILNFAFKIRQVQLLIQTMYLLGVTDAAVSRFGLRHATVLLLEHFLIQLLHSCQLILQLVYAGLLSIDYILLLPRFFSLVVELTLQLN